MATGTIMLADAVLEVASDSRIADAGEDHGERQRRLRRQPRGDAPAQRLGQVLSETPARPAPARRRTASTMPQSMRTASSQVNVKRRARQSTGSTNSSSAPIIAATPSGTAF